MSKLMVLLALILVAAQTHVASANLLVNGNLDRSVATEIVPGFFLPKPANWVNEGFRTISGPYEDEMSSEPWAGPAPTPVTADGLLDPPHPAGVGGLDGAVFFKPFSGNATDGLATGHLYQSVPGTPGVKYQLTGWAGAEANALMGGAEFGLEFLNGLNIVLGGAIVNLLPTLFVDNGQAFDYKQYTVSAIAPVGTVSVRARASMINALGNPAGGGQAFVVDDFELTTPDIAAIVPEPATATLGVMGLAGLLLRRRTR